MSGVGDGRALLVWVSSVGEELPDSLRRGGGLGGVSPKAPLRFPVDDCVL